MSVGLDRGYCRFFKKCGVAATIEVTTTFETIISMVVENACQKWTPVATTIEVTPTIEIIISIADVISIVVIN